jgi:hypothetical protein
MLRSPPRTTGSLLGAKSIPRFWYCPQFEANFPGYRHLSRHFGLKGDFRAPGAREHRLSEKVPASAPASTSRVHPVLAGGKTRSLSDTISKGIAFPFDFRAGCSRCTNWTPVGSSKWSKKCVGKTTSYSAPRLPTTGGRRFQTCLTVFALCKFIAPQAAPLAYSSPAA